MNWKLILVIALTGPLVAIAGNYGYIVFDWEPYVAISIFFISAILFSILKTGKYFLHGFITALIFGILMTLVRLKFMQQYINANPDAINKGEDMLHRFHYIRSPMVIISIFVVITSIVSGIVAWISGFIATKILSKKA